eukprot:SAG11_NODE_43520_length_164_cov_455.307692_1_plen_35_part_01
MISDKLLKKILIIIFVNIKCLSIIVLSVIIIMKLN